MYRPNEVNVHSALKHKNILPLLAVLMGEQHSAGWFYCYHFMPKMDHDLRQILSTKEVGCLKYLYRNCLSKFDRAFSKVYTKGNTESFSLCSFQWICTQRCKRYVRYIYIAIDIALAKMHMVDF